MTETINYRFSPGWAMSSMRLGMCAIARPRCAEDPVRRLCCQLSENKYALGMRQTLFSPRIRMTPARMRWGMRKDQNPLQRSRLRLCCFGKRRYAPRCALNLKLPCAAWGSLPSKLGMRRVCASHIPRWPSGSRSGMRWLCAMYMRIVSLKSKRSLNPDNA